MKEDGKIASEDDALRIIDSFFPRAHDALLLGRGDDCAEFFTAPPLALSTDLFLEDVHFRRSYFAPEEIGHKALAVNLSDLAAAGARPAGFSLGLMCPPNLERGWLRRLFKGMSALAARYGLPLTGGDISAAPILGFSITVWGGSWLEADSCLASPCVSGARRSCGESPDSAGPAGHVGTSAGFTARGRDLKSPFIRRGAEPGDMLFVLSPGRFEREAVLNGVFESVKAGYAAEAGPCVLGLAAAGLALLERNGRAAEEIFPQACAALLRPQPLVAAGRALALASIAGAGGGVRVCAMDLSDGLRRDLPRLLNGKARNEGVFPADGAGLGADLDFDPRGLHPELLRYAASLSPEGREAEACGSSVSELPPHLRQALLLALRGGDEYALLCACPAQDFENLADALSAFAPGVGIKVIGRASARPGLRWRGLELNRLLSGGGFDHFNG